MTALVAEREILPRASRGELSVSFTQYIKNEKGSHK
jgi:hypothetical protein